MAPVTVLQSQLTGFRGGTISPALVDSVRIHYQGQMVPLNHLAYSSPGKGAISVVPFDHTMVGPIAKTLCEQGLNAYAQSKTTVVVSVPKPNGEEQAKVHARIRKLGEEAKLAIRNVRRRLLNAVSGSEDVKKREEKLIQARTDEAIAMADQAVANRIANC